MSITLNKEGDITLDGNKMSIWQLKHLICTLSSIKYKEDLISEITFQREAVEYTYPLTKGAIELCKMERTTLTAAHVTYLITGYHWDKGFED